LKRGALSNCGFSSLLIISMSVQNEINYISYAEMTDSTVSLK
jgi:hypothetical protein